MRARRKRWSKSYWNANVWRRCRTPCRCFFDVLLRLFWYWDVWVKSLLVKVSKWGCGGSMFQRFEEKYAVLRFPSLRQTLVSPRKMRSWGITEDLRLIWNASPFQSLASTGFEDCCFKSIWIQDSVGLCLRYVTSYFIVIINFRPSTPHMFFWRPEQALLHSFWECEKMVGSTFFSDLLWCWVPCHSKKHRNMWDMIWGPTIAHT